MSKHYSDMLRNRNMSFIGTYKRVLKLPLSCFLENWCYYVTFLFSYHLMYASITGTWRQTKYPISLPEFLMGWLVCGNCRFGIPYLGNAVDAKFTFTLKMFLLPYPKRSKHSIIVLPYHKIKMNMCRIFFPHKKFAKKVRSLGSQCTAHVLHS